MKVLSDAFHKLIMTKSETLIFVPLLEHTLQLFAMLKNLNYLCLLSKFDSVNQYTEIEICVVFVT